MANVQSLCILALFLSLLHLIINVLFTQTLRYIVDLLNLKIWKKNGEQWYNVHYINKPLNVKPTTNKIKSLWTQHKYSLSKEL